MMKEVSSGRRPGPAILDGFKDTHNYLDADEIRSIVDAFLADVKMITIAERFGVSVITVSNAVKNALILEKLERAQAVALLTGAPSAD